MRRLSEWAPKPITCILLRGRQNTQKRGRQGDHGAEMGLVRPQAKEHWQPPKVRNRQDSPSEPPRDRVSDNGDSDFGSMILILNCGTLLQQSQDIDRVSYQKILLFYFRVSRILITSVYWIPSMDQAAAVTTLMDYLSSQNKTVLKGSCSSLRFPAKRAALRRVRGLPGVTQQMHSGAGIELGTPDSVTVLALLEKWW